VTAEQLAREIIDKLNEHEHASYEEAIELVAEVVAPLASDAERWRYVRDKCIRADPKMDGTSYFMFRQLHGNRGLTIEEVIDRKRGDT